MIYVLLLEEKKIYVGYTARPLNDRVIEHFSGIGAKWTTKYKPVEVLEVHQGGLKEENQITLKMMERYGWWNVRGGSWCTLEMNRCPQALLKLQNAKLPQEIAFTQSVNFQKPSKRCCFRCGRNSHYEKDCYAKSTIEGYYIGDTDSESEDESDW